MRTLEQGLHIATSKKENLYVTKGNYLLMSPMLFSSGVSLYGGFTRNENGEWIRNSGSDDYTSVTVIGSLGGLAIDINEPITMELFNITVCRDCAKTGTIGSFCDSSLECIGWCNQGECANKKQNGEDCTLGDECVSNYCSSMKKCDINFKPGESSYGLIILNTQYFRIRFLFPFLFVFFFLKNS